MTYFQTTLLAVALSASAALAAEPCDAPGARDLKPLQIAIASDDAVAGAFEATANACPPVPQDGCDAQKLKCGETLSENLKRVIGFDEGSWVRDMLLPYLGQSYKPTVVLPTVVTPATDVSCTADHLTLRAAAQRRRQQSQRRRLVADEYGKWQVWAMAVRTACVDKVKAQKEQQDATAAEAARLAAAAAAGKAAEESRQAELRRAEAQRQADLRRAEDQRQADIKRQQQALEDARKTEAQRKADYERDQLRKQAEAEAAAKAKAEQQAVVEREGRKRAQEQHVDELKQKEEQRRLDAEDQLKAEKLNAQAEHDKKIERLKRDLALSEEEKSKSLAEEDAAFKLAEETRRRNAAAEIAKAAKIDRSDERMKGNLALHAVGGIGLLNGAAGGVLGLHFRGRIAVWGLAPADGMASGFELKLIATLLGMPGTSPSFLQFEGGGEVRGWYRRVALGLSASFDHLSSTLNADDGTGQQTALAHSADSLALGPTLSLAIVDNPNQQFIISARWLPTFQGDLVRFAGEFEIAFDWFSITVLAGAKNDSHVLDGTGASVPRLGFWAVAGIGGRLRW